MHVLVTGANGMLGIDLCRMLEEAGHSVVRTDVGAREGMTVPAWERLDMTDPENVASLILHHQPDAVIHTAAYTDVDGCERDPDKAYRFNAQGTWNVAAVCGAHNILLVYISTDFIFDGAKTEPYTEFDTPNPLSHYGGSKLAGERLVAQLCRKHFIARTSWLFGVHGPSFPGKMIDLAATKTELNVVCDQVGSPTHTIDLAAKIISLLPTSLYGTYHISNRGSCSWCEFASATLRLAGKPNVIVHPMPASQWPSPTRRPAYSVLRHFALELQGKDDLRTWQDSLEEYIALRNR